MAERESVGMATYTRVQQLVAEGLTRSAAFARVAEDTGRGAGTVATAFYRVARQQPNRGGVQGRRPRKRARRRLIEATPEARHGRSATEALIADLQRGIDALAKHAQRLEADVTELRANGERIEKIRRALG
jgi:hypothetical protein